MTNLLTVRVLLLDPDLDWCNAISANLIKRLQNKGYLCIVHISNDWDNALQAIEDCPPDLIIASEYLKRYSSVRDVQGLLFLEKVDHQCPDSLKILILDRKASSDKEIKGLVSHFCISAIFQRNDIARDILKLLDAIIRLLKPIDFFARGYALLIGVGADLPSSTKDVNALYRVLVRPNFAAYLKENIILLKEQDATRENILNAVDQLALKVQTDPTATVSIYFSGHGAYLKETGDYLLIPYGCSLDDCIESSISGQELTQQVYKIQSQRLIVWLDCCHADDILEKAWGKILVQSPPTPQMITTLKSSRGRLVVASSSQEQFPYIGELYSIFTTCLVDALKGKASQDANDNYVRICDVLSYLLREVPKRARPNQQSPVVTLIEDLEENFPICLRSQVDIPNDLVGTPTPNHKIPRFIMQKRRDRLEKAIERQKSYLEDLEEELEATYRQWTTTLSEGDRVRLKKKMKQIEQDQETGEQELILLEQKLLDLDEF